MVPKEYIEHYNFLLYEDTLLILTLGRYSDDSWSRKFERIRNSPDCILFRKDLPISVTFVKQLKSELVKYNIVIVKKSY
jgi:hypothetical protein